MDYFYIIVSVIAIVVLIILLTIVGISLRNHSTSPGGNTWPPTESTCPDYWKVDKNDSTYCMLPDSNGNYRNSGSIFKTVNNASVLDGNFTTTNVKGYDANASRINFADPYYTACNKQSWAKKWNVYWDGYTNYNGCTSLSK
jgi:hypothetical protein